MKMLRTLLILGAFVAATALPALAQGAIEGAVTDGDTGALLPGVNVVVKGTNIGATTDATGRYVIEAVPAGPQVVLASFIGYASAETPVVVRDGETVTANLAITGTTLRLGELTVVSASRRGEKITDAPATIGVITPRQIQEHPSPNIGELTARVKGVDYLRTGVVGTGFNVRGFNSAFNPKNLQMTDGRLSSLVATGLPLGPLSTTVKEDIERVEIVLGPTAALYGPNAHNGLINIITHDPRTSEGSTVVLGGGTQSMLTTRARHAQVINDRLAFKLSGAFTRGTEFDYVDSVYVGGIGFDELQLDRDFDSIAGEASVYFTPAPDSDFILTYGGSNNNNIGVTNAGRNQIRDWTIHLLQGRYVSPRLFAQVYHTWSQTDETYAINQRTQNYRSFIVAGFSEEEALRRSFAEQWVGPSPQQGVALPRGAIFRDNSRRLNAEVQYNNQFGALDLTVGTQYQRDMADSRGTYLIDEGGITFNQFGVYAQMKAPLGAGFETVLAARGDNHDQYGFNFIPKAALLYQSPVGTFRATYALGIAAPTILNTSMNLFGGLVLGNAVGFTLSDGSTIAPLEVETIQTVEVGYKGVLGGRWFIDTNAYYNMSKNFISPLINIAPTAFVDGVVVAQRGDQPISDFQPGLAIGPGDFVLTYVNFGAVDTYGFDLGVSFYPTEAVDVTLNYSFFDYSFDREDPANDSNRDGRIDEVDIPINTPNHKASLGVGYRHGNLFGSVFGRWVQEFDFFSGIQVAARTNEDLIIGGDPVIEGRRVGRDFNSGPLGGFVNFDLSAGYRITPMFTVAGQVVNVFDSNVREFAGSPVIGRMMMLELRMNL
jgi:outer membrane receptor for ferrienterochelin and colicins